MAKQSDSKVARRLADLQSRLLEAEDTLNAIRDGAVDALVVRTPRGEQLFTLKGADQTYRVLVEGMNEGALTIRRGIISYCNNRFAEMSGTPMEKVFGSSILKFISAPGLPSIMRRLEKGSTSSDILEGELHSSGGASIPVRLSVSRFHSEGVPTISVVLTDMTAQKAAQRASQELSRNVINAQEQERQRVARDLHDSVNQLLSTAKYRLATLTRHLPDSDSTRALQLVHSVIDKALAEVRTISRNLRPSELDDLGLVAAVRSLVREFRERSGINARFNHDLQESLPRISKEVELAVYRIAQEALNNVEKHSKAAWVVITLGFSRDSHVVLTVRDNGKGFLFGKRKSTGAGLQNITERAALLKGRVKVSSARGKGTKVTVQIPPGAEVHPRETKGK